MTDKQQKDIRDKLDNKIKEVMVQRQFPWYQGMALKGTTGSVMGYAAGVFAKQISEILIFWAGVGGATLGFLHWAKYITIHFDKIDADILHVRAKAEEGGDKSLVAKA